GWTSVSNCSRTVPWDVPRADGLRWPMANCPCDCPVAPPMAPLEQSRLGLVFDQPTIRGCALRNGRIAGWLTDLRRPLPAEIPRRCILEISVVLDSPSLAAAPSQPPSTPFVA